VSFSRITSDNFIDLAIQGGGSNGIYAKAVLEVILSDLCTKGTLRNVTATSAGALNAACLVSALNKYGQNEQGIQKAIEGMNRVWSEIAFYGQFSGLPRHLNPVDIGRGQVSFLRALWGNTAIDGLMNFVPDRLNPEKMADQAWPNIPQSMRVSSPLLRSFYEQAIPNYIEDLMRRIIDFDAIAKGPIKLFINTSERDPKTGEYTHHCIYEGAQISSRIIAGSASILAPHHGMLDGGFIANPALDPLLQEEERGDILLIGTNAIPQELDSFGAALMKPCTYHTHGDFHFLESHDHGLGLRLHSIHYDPPPTHTDSRKFNTDPAYLKAICEAGTRDARRFLQTDLQSIGQTSTYRLDEKLLGHLWAGKKSVAHSALPALAQAA
jgi:NTE family protein